MILLLILITTFFLAINYVIADNDYMHPAVVFHLVFLLYESICLGGTLEYAITLHIKSTIVLIIGFIAITVANILSNKQGNKRLFVGIDINEIKIHKKYYYTIIMLQLISIAFFYVYLKRIAIAYGSSYGNMPGSLSEMIQLYDTLTKFWTKIFKKLSVPIPMAYRVTNPICVGAEYIVLYIMVNNFIGKKRINIYSVVVLSLMCVRIVMNGSRSPLLRIFTYIFLLVYVLKYQRGQIQKGNKKFLWRIITASIGFGALMFLVLIIMGRSENLAGSGDQIFVYLGAPIVNLDLFMERNEVKLFGSLDSNSLFGAHTFGGLYSYIGKIFKFIYIPPIETIGTFEFSNNGREIGNVYTMFFKLVYDFGFIGVFIFTFIMGVYYCFSYHRIMKQPKKRKVIDFRLLVYAYLFNDVVMSAFSARFYETVFNAAFIKFLFMAWVLDIVFVEKKIVYRKLHNVQYQSIKEEIK